MITAMTNTIVKLDGEIIDFDAVEYSVNKEGFPVPTLDIILKLKCGGKVYDDGSRVEIIHNNCDT